jgi:hypothetical protein
MLELVFWQVLYAFQHGVFYSTGQVLQKLKAEHVLHFALYHKCTLPVIIESDCSEWRML